MILPFLFILLLPVFVIAQTAIKGGNGEMLYLVKENQLIDAKNGVVLLTTQGNIVFNGSKTEKDDMSILVGGTDVFSKKQIRITEPTSRRMVYTLQLGELSSAYPQGALMTYPIILFEAKKNGGILCKRADTEAILAETDTDIPVAILIGMLDYSLNGKGLKEEILKNQQQRRSLISPGNESADIEDISSTSGSLRRVWGSSNEEFIWDGVTLKRKWDNNMMQEWQFDGKVLSRTWFPGQVDFIWDGSILKRRYTYNADEEFIYDGNTFRPRYGNFSREYSIRNNLVTPTYTADQSEQWQIDGEVPVPIIILVVFGLVYR